MKTVLDLSDPGIAQKLVEGIDHVVGPDIYWFLRLCKVRSVRLWGSNRNYRFWKAGMEPHGRGRFRRIFINIHPANSPYHRAFCLGHELAHVLLDFYCLIATPKGPRPGTHIWAGEAGLRMEHVCDDFADVWLKTYGTDSYMRPFIEELGGRGRINVGYPIFHL